ncbi:MAG: lipid-A-disaccharide synthase N-terminal domain-containing protein [Phycisphaerales bacterium]
MKAGPVHKKKVKWEPAALMVIVLGLGMWIAFGPASRPSFDKRPGALWQDIRIGNERGILEAARPPEGGAASEHTFRVIMRDSPPSREYTRTEAEAIFGQRLIEQTVRPRGNGVFRWLNITSWTGVVWLSIGLLGQIAFSGRMVLQWITSEKRRQSIITESFWWFSLFGSVTLFSYFVWRQDPVAMLGQASGLVIYSRNLRLIYKAKRRAARQPKPSAPPQPPAAAHAASRSRDPSTAAEPEVPASSR